MNRNASALPRAGVALCLVSAAGFGTMAIFAKLAYGAGAEVTPLLSLRFAAAAVILWAIVAARRTALPTPRVAAAALLLGALGYAAQSGLYFGALERLDASLTSLLLYTYPALVTLLAVLTRKDVLTGRRALALATASGGVALVLLGGDGALAAVSSAGIALALGAATAYAVYILVSEGLARRIAPIAFAAMTCTGAALTFTAVTLATGPAGYASMDMDAYAAIAAMALLSTVLPIATFYAGVAEVGPSTASILSTIEPPITVALAFVVFGERLGPVQLLGGAGVLCAVLVLQARAIRRPRRAERPALAGA